MKVGYCAPFMHAHCTIHFPLHQKPKVPAPWEKCKEFTYQAKTLHVLHHLIWKSDHVSLITIHTPINIYQAIIATTSAFHNTEVKVIHINKQSNQHSFCRFMILKLLFLLILLVHVHQNRENKTTVKKFLNIALMGFIPKVVNLKSQ